MFEKLIEELGEVMMVLLTIFFTFDSKFMSFLRSLVPTCMMVNSGFLSNTLSIFVKYVCCLPLENSVHEVFSFSIYHGC